MPKHNDAFNKKFASLLHILGMLASGRKVSTSNIMGSLEISSRTVSRYISILQGAGYPIYFDRERMSYRFVDGFNPTHGVGITQIESLDLKNRIFASSPIGMVSFDHAGQCIEVNESAAKILGATRDQLKNQNYNRIHSWQDSGLLERAKEVLCTGKDYSGDFFIESSFGKNYWLNCNISRFEKDDGKYITLAIQDVTARKDLELALINTSNELFAAQRLGKMGSWTIDLATNKVNWTPELYRMFKLSPDEPAPDYTLHKQLFTQESWVLLENSLTKAVTEGIPYELELELVRSDGSRGWMLAIGEADFNIDDAVIGLHGIALDITERKEMQRNAKENEELLREVLKVSPIVAFVKDENLRILHISERAEEDIGIPWAEMIGKENHELFPEELAKKITADDRGVLDSGKSAELEELVGSRIARIFKYPIILGGRKYLAGYAIDITDQRAYENNLRLSERQFANAFNHAPIGMALVAPDGRWLKVNKAFCDIVGFTEEELLSKTFQDITNPDDNEPNWDLVRQMLAGDLPTCRIEKRYVRKDGRTIWMLICVSLVRDEDERPLHFILHIVDISALKQSEGEQLHQDEQKLSGKPRGVGRRQRP